MQQNSYLEITVCVYYEILNTVTTEIKRFLGVYNLSKATLIRRQHTLSKKALLKNLRINFKNVCPTIKMNL